MLTAHSPSSVSDQKLAQLRQALAECVKGTYVDPEEQQKANEVAGILNNKHLKTADELLKQIGQACYYDQLRVYTRYHKYNTLYKLIDDALCQYYDIAKDQIALAMMSIIRDMMGQDHRYAEYVKCLNMARGKIITNLLPPPPSPPRKPKTLQEKLIECFMEHRESGADKKQKKVIERLLEEFTMMAEEESIELALAALLLADQSELSTHLRYALEKIFCEHLGITKNEIDLEHFNLFEPTFKERGNKINFNYDQIRHEAQLKLIRNKIEKRLAKTPSPETKTESTSVEKTDESKEEPPKNNIKRLQATLNYFLTLFIAEEKKYVKGVSHTTFSVENANIVNATTLLRTINENDSNHREWTETSLLNELHKKYYSTSAIRSPDTQTRMLLALDKALFNYFSFTEDDLFVQTMDLVILQFHQKVSACFPRDLDWARASMLSKHIYHMVTHSMQQFVELRKDEFQAVHLMQDLGSHQKDTLQTRLVNSITHYLHSNKGGGIGAQRAEQLLAKVNLEDNETALFEMIINALSDDRNQSLLGKSVYLRAEVGKALCCHFGITERTVSLQQYNEFRDRFEKNQSVNVDSERNQIVCRLVKEARDSRLVAVCASATPIDSSVVVHRSPSPRR